MPIGYCKAAGQFDVDEVLGGKNTCAEARSFEVTGFQKLADHRSVKQGALEASANARRCPAGQAGIARHRLV